MALPAHHRTNFATILRAAAAGRLALLEVRERATGAVRAAVVTVSDADDGEYELAPFALMIEGNPFELLDAPDPGGGFATGDK